MTILKGQSDQFTKLYKSFRCSSACRGLHGPEWLHTTLSPSSFTPHLSGPLSQSHACSAFRRPPHWSQGLGSVAAPFPSPAVPSSSTSSQWHSQLAPAKGCFTTYLSTRCAILLVPGRAGITVLRSHSLPCRLSPQSTGLLLTEAHSIHLTDIFETLSEQNFHSSCRQNLTSIPFELVTSKPDYIGPSVYIPPIVIK